LILNYKFRCWCNYNWMF